MEPLQAQVFNRAPLTGGDYAELPLGAVRAAGWLQEQLQRQADGLTGHLDEVYPQVMGEGNAWLGGDGDAWERGPYWIDGLLPLAYLLKDEALIKKANRWVEAILSSQSEDGYLGPATDHPFVYGLQRGQTHDWWPKMVALKILKQYYLATEDPRVPDCLLRYFRYQWQTLAEKPLDHWTDWGRWRGADNLDVVYWLYNLTGEPFLLELGKLIHSQTVDWTALFQEGAVFSEQGSIHCVNLGQGFKAPAVWWQYSQDEKDLEALQEVVRTIRHTVGFPTGLWAGDEKLHWGDPSRGSELCTAVEMMYSLETMLRITGNPFWADYLERVAYNALPTQVNDSYTAKQYYQQVNQVSVTKDWRPFSTPHDDTDVLYGTLNGYPCCLSNMHQGWPKFTRNLWYATRDGGLAALIYAPCRVETRVGGIPVCIEEQTQYPFREEVSFRLSFPKERKKRFTASFPLRFRIPEWCLGLTVLVDGQAVEIRPEKGIVCLDGPWKNGSVITLRFEAQVRLEAWYDQALSVVRGPLVYALNMEEKWEWKSFEGRDRYYGEGAWEVTSDTPWNYCLMRDSLKPEDCLVEESAVTSYPWTRAEAPLHLRVPARELPHWTVPEAISYWTEEGNDTGREVVLDLIPYGCTTLRIAAFPSRIIPWDLSYREPY